MTKLKILSILKQGSRTAKELAQMFNIEKGTIYCHLKGWKRSKESEKKSTPGLVDVNYPALKGGA